MSQCKHARSVGNEIWFCLHEENHGGDHYYVAPLSVIEKIDELHERLREAEQRVERAHKALRWYEKAARTADVADLMVDGGHRARIALNPEDRL